MAKAAPSASFTAWWAGGIWVMPGPGGTTLSAAKDWTFTTSSWLSKCIAKLGSHVLLLPREDTLGQKPCISQGGDKIGQHLVSTSDTVLAHRELNPSLEAARPKAAALRDAGMSNPQRLSFAQHGHQLPALPILLGRAWLQTQRADHKPRLHEPIC